MPYGIAPFFLWLLRSHGSLKPVPILLTGTVWKPLFAVSCEGGFCNEMVEHGTYCVGY